jgi:Holliday junction resolvase RusA-like endonuclease
MPYPKKYFRTGKFKGQLKANAPEKFINRPDIDNLLKFVMDAGNKVLWHDDCQIWKVTMEKIYSLEPGTKIIVEETDESFQKDR